MEPLDGYALIHRRWSQGDKIEIDLPMPVVCLESHPLVEETHGQLAVKRGPIVYCLESADLPEGARVLDVFLPREAKLVPRRSNEMGGATVIEGKGVANPRRDWGDDLYRDYSPDAAEPREFHLVLVPYYAWDNRGAGEMSVWLPLAH